MALCGPWWLNIADTKMQGSQSMNNVAETSSALEKGMEGGSFQDAYPTNDMVSSIGG